MISQPQFVSSLIGHNGKCYNLKFSPCNEYLLTASEDSTAKLWDYSTKRAVFTFPHNKDAEVLRASFLGNGILSLVTCSANGSAVVWSKNSVESREPIAYSEVCKLLHGDAQIYACEPLPLGNGLITAADDSLFVWDLQAHRKLNTFTFSQSRSDDGSIHFGGPRNPNNLVYIFDAKLSSDFVIASALSDGSVACVDIRSSSVSRRFLRDLAPASLTSNTGILSFPSLTASHITSLTWTADASTLALSLGNGNIALLDTRMGVIRAILTGHRSSCFGTVFIGDQPSGESKCLSWSSDGSIRLWDASSASGIVSAQLSGYQFDNFPVYDCAVRSADGNIACAGGGNGSFLGYPVHIVEKLPSPYAL